METEFSLLYLQQPSPAPYPYPLRILISSFFSIHFSINLLHIKVMSVLREVRSLFHSEFPTEYNVVLPFSISSILSLP
jgi:hypothetical protein